MIKSIEQARRVQAKRASKGKKGYAKAVRRFLQREYQWGYMEKRNQLAAIWK